jgi:16S rRNA (guanine527-N7)-methyltransferase
MESSTGGSAAGETSAEDTLTAAVARHGITLTDRQMAGIEAYVRQLWDWNSRLNLTRHTDYERFVTRDLVDSLELAKLLQGGEKVLDFGSGGGVPGLVVALLRDDVEVTLCESVGKKARALEAMVAALRDHLPVQRPKIYVQSRRVEEVLRNRRFDVVMARAVGPLPDILRWLKDRWPSIGRLLLIKGPKWPDERAAARHRGQMHDLQLRVAATYPLADTGSDSVILKLERAVTPEAPVE